MTHKQQFLMWLAYAIATDHEAYLQHANSGVGAPYAWHMTVIAGFDSPENHGKEKFGLQLFQRDGKCLINTEWGGCMRPRFSQKFQGGDSRACVNDLLLSLDTLDQPWLTEEYCQKFMQKKSAYGFTPELSMYQ